METYSDGDIENEREALERAQDQEDWANGYESTPCPYPPGKCLIHGKEWGEEVTDDGVE